MSDSADATCDTFASAIPFAITAGLVAMFVALLVGGTIVLIMSRRRGGYRTPRLALPVTLLLLVALAGADVAAPPAANAAMSACIAHSASLTVSQVATIRNLSPGSEALPISGMVTNTGVFTILITEVHVSISHVAGTVDGERSCAANNFAITGARMPVNVTLAPGASTAFSGAKIGFANLARNQDSCKGVTLQLRYDFSGP